MSKLTLRAIALLTATAVTVSGCSGGSTDTSDPQTPLVATTFTVLADMTSAIAGDRVRVESITRTGAEIHQYEPTPGDVRRVHDAQLIIDTGLGLELWFERFLGKVDAPHVVATEGIDPMPIRSGEYTGAPNPHAWMSPIAAKTYVDNITRGLIDVDPEGREEFEARAADYKAELDGLHERLVSEIGSLPESARMLVTCEGAFSYLARDADLDEGYIWAVNAESQGTPQQIADLVTTVRERKVPAVFCESTVSDASMQQVARESGSRFAGTLFVDSLSEADGPVPTYLDLIGHDIDVITKGLTAS